MLFRSDVLDATLNKNGDVVASYLHNIHNSELPILKYNDENSLSCVVTLAYLSDRNKYKVEREEKSGKGFVDFIFYPRKRNRLRLHTKRQIPCGICLRTFVRLLFHKFLFGCLLGKLYF